MTLTSTGPAADGLLDLNSITADGFTLIVDDQVPVNITVFWEAWGGSDITAAATGEIAEPAATGNVDYTVTGSFQPSVVMFAGVQATGAAPTVARNDSGLCVGAASSGSAANNIVIVANNDDGSGTIDSDDYGLAGECLAMITVAGGNPNARATLTQFNADGFRLNWIARGVTSRKSIYLAIAGGSWSVGDLTINFQSLNSTVTVSGLSFTPIGLQVISCFITESTPGTSATGAELAWGIGTTTSSRRTLDCFVQNGTANTEIAMRIEYDQILCTVTSSTDATLFTSEDIDAMLSDGFRLIVDTANAGANATTWAGYLTFGSTPAAGGRIFKLAGEGGGLAGPARGLAACGTLAPAAMYRGNQVLTPSQRYYRAHPEKAQAATRRWKAANKARHQAQQRAWYAANKEWSHLCARLQKRGLTLDQYAAIEEAQDWTCAICGRDGELHLDHDHTSNKVRGLLCQRCNLGIGQFADNPATLLSAARYMEVRG
jgi:hypothetical protein